MLIFRSLLERGMGALPLLTVLWRVLLQALWSCPAWPHSLTKARLLISLESRQPLSTWIWACPLLSSVLPGDHCPPSCTVLLTQDFSRICFTSWRPPWLVTPLPGPHLALGSLQELPHPSAQRAVLGLCSCSDPMLTVGSTLSLQLD